MLGDPLADTAGQSEHESVANRRARVHKLLPGLSSMGPPEVIESLARLHADATGDRTLLTIVDAAEQIAVRWREEHDKLDRHWLAYEKALAAESEVRRTLDTLLRTLASVAESSLTAPKEAPDTDGWDLTGLDNTAPGPAVRSNKDPGSCPPDMTSLPEMAVCLLGRFRLFHRGHEVEGWHGSKTPRIVRYLFAQRDRPVPRDVLIDLFWPDADPETARRNLHQTIYVVRKALRAGCDPNQHIVFADEAYTVKTSAGVWCDAEEFEAQARAGRSAERELREEDAIVAYEAAERIYRGDYLEDSPYEEWAMPERDRLRLLYLDTANRLADLKLAMGDAESALELTQRALLRDPCDEAAHRCALRCHEAAGNRNQVIRQYQACVDALDRAYGLEPTRETTELYALLLGS